ncbi:uncharacterized protein DMENIID0001_135320 [Sergentomyia squamirostris]
MLALRPALVRLATRNLGAVSPAVRCYHGHNPHRASNMDDLPTPEGDFYELHSKRQARYNRALVGGVLTFIVTLMVVKESGLVHLNYSPPSTYE